MGKRIVEQLTKKALASAYFGLTGDDNHSAKEKYEKITNSYLIACLLHDIAHAPFSHTFEKYYGTPKQLCEKLNSLLEPPIHFEEDDYSRIKEHELASAMLILDEFRDLIEGNEFQGDSELAVRMVIGQQYRGDALSREMQIRNCFISLLNGCIVDADRLDYASRDIWASGYKTATIDFERLISNIDLRIDPKTNYYVICFSVDVINEIQSLCEIKQFQAEHVFCHHTIMYEQYLFDKAAEKMMQIVEGDEELGLRKIINYSTFKKPKQLTFHIGGRDNVHWFYMVADEDILFLLKQVPDNEYYDNWAKRNYTMQTLWETEDAFFYKFPRDNRFLGPKNNELIKWISDYLEQNGFAGDTQYLVKPYSRKTSPVVLPIYVITHEGNVERYSSYLHKDEDGPAIDNYFYYVYVDKDIWGGKPYEEKDFIYHTIGNKILEYCQ